MTQPISQLTSWPYTDKVLPLDTANERHWLQFWNTYKNPCTSYFDSFSRWSSNATYVSKSSHGNPTSIDTETPSMNRISFHVINVTHNSIEKIIMWHTVVHVKSDVNIVVLTLNTKDTWTITSIYNTRTKNICVLNVGKNILRNETWRNTSKNVVKR